MPTTKRIASEPVVEVEDAVEDLVADVADCKPTDEEAGLEASNATPDAGNRIDEATIADALVAKGYTLEAAFVRHFDSLRTTTTTCQDLVEAVCPGEQRDWATVKTWVNRVKNALLDLDPPSRMTFHTTIRGHLITKKLPPE